MDQKPYDGTGSRLLQPTLRLARNKNSTYRTFRSSSSYSVVFILSQLKFWSEMEVGESSSPHSTPGREVTSLHTDSSSSLWEPRCPVSHLFIRGRKVGQVRAHLVGLYDNTIKCRGSGSVGSVCFWASCIRIR